MKKFRLLVGALLLSSSVMAQVDFSNPAYAKWGETPADREANMFNSTYMREAIDNKEFDAAAGYFQKLMASCPAASEAVFGRAVQLYKAKIARAGSLTEKRAMVDSLMIVHDLRAQYFGDSEKRGTAYILDSKARDYYNYNKADREGLRDTFRAAIAAGGATTDPALVYLYFVNLCEDYKMDEVMADEVIAEYDALTPFFAALTGDNAEYQAKFDTSFSTSGVASCENLESIFKAKLAATPNDEKVLAQAVKLMDRENCRTPFYAQVAEKYYLVSPNSRAAMALATIFQNDGDFDKASKYLRDAMAAESDVEEKEALLARIALIELAANRMDAALTAAKASLATADGTESDNGIALFVIAQCYGASAAKFNDIKGQIAYLAAYDMMARAVKNFSADEQAYKAPATAMLAQFKAFFPTTEECFFNEVEKGSTVKVEVGVAAGVSTVVRTRD